MEKEYLFNDNFFTFNTNELNQFILNSKNCQVNADFSGVAGNEHYRLLSFFSTKVDNSIILDVGSNHGFSALALSYNPANTVYSFDIEDKVNSDIKDVTNINFVIDDILDPLKREKWHDTIINSAIIFLDIDPHEGNLEYSFYKYLKKNNYKGILICDDIWMFKGMRDNFWFSIPPFEKADLTPFGHFSGTGVVTFFNTKNPETKDPSNPKNLWTFVTAYFNLTKCFDASQKIKDRDLFYYIENANGTMAIDANLVVFCDKESYPFLMSLRPSYLSEKTKYIVCDFEDFPLTKYRSKVIQNRVDHPYNFDERNTASYYLFCMARYDMMKQIIASNPFNSTHFAWVNICIERMGYKNLMNFENVMNEMRDKFSTCYIDYIPESLVNNLPEYFKFGRCSMCSGFFTGNAFYMKRFCDEIEKQFLEYLELGYGHADEQLYSPVFFKNRDIFDFYYGDYGSMVTNYDRIRSHHREIVRNFVGNSFRGKEYDLCAEAHSELHDSFEFSESGDRILDNERENYYTFGLGLCGVRGEAGKAISFLLKRELVKLGL